MKEYLSVEEGQSTMVCCANLLLVSSLVLLPLRAAVSQNVFLY